MSHEPQKTILVIDDAALIRLYYRSTLEEAGYRVEEALNGLEALEKLLAHPADLLIDDINMPQMDGITLPGCSAAQGAALVRRSSTGHQHGGRR